MTVSVYDCEAIEIIIITERCVLLSCFGGGLLCLEEIPPVPLFGRPTVTMTAKSVTSAAAVRHAKLPLWVPESLETTDVAFSAGESCGEMQRVVAIELDVIFQHSPC